jgi:hypothetical protein
MSLDPLLKGLPDLVKAASEELRARANEAAFALSPTEALRVAVSNCMCKLWSLPVNALLTQSSIQSRAAPGAFGVPSRGHRPGIGF